MKVDVEFTDKAVLSERTNDALDIRFNAIEIKTMNSVVRCLAEAAHGKFHEADAGSVKGRRKFRQNGGIGAEGDKTVFLFRNFNDFRKFRMQHRLAPAVKVNFCIRLDKPLRF